MLQNWSLQKKIFATYSIIIVLIIVCFVATFAVYASKMIQNNLYSGTERLLQKITEQFDGLIGDMERINVSLLMDENLNKHLYNPGSIPSLGVQETRKLTNSIFSINGPFSSAYKIVAFNFEHKYALSPQSVDNADTLFKAGIDGIPIFESLAISDGGFKLLPPHLDNWSQLQVPVFSLSRKIMDAAGKEYGYIEVQQRYSELSRLYDPDPSIDSEFYIFNEAGNLFYPQPIIDPLKSLEDAGLYQTSIFDGKSGSTTVRNSKGEARLLTYRQSPLTGHVIVISQSRQEALASVNLLSTLILGAGLLILIVTLIILYSSSKRLTLPLRTLGSSLKQVSLSNLALNIENTDKNNEMQLLDRMFKKMFSRLQHSIEQITEAKEREAKAQLLALQSQINPHFIHNTLATIGAAAKHADQREKVVEMCRQLSSLLHYTTSSADCVRVEDELQYTKNYLNLLKYRYEEHFSFAIDVDRELLNIEIPRITIQPFVENAMKHAFNTVPPPWHIRICGTFRENKWELSISDDGAGADESRLNAIRERVDVIIANREQSEDTASEETEGEGLGIVNTFARLVLLFGEQTWMTIENLPERGLRVSFGATIKK
ncbi:sensor histidine kinase [Cohnella sp. WQ 127256]|uniref:cache domain-containing sensor histidine kinase n=1 Tax=Cohnella sp. WQ 127256 TaxID=2938790 RepID=UPI0021189E68|nr:sensor histidine kinase [Cohnella sp. WQ 127256]